METGLALVISVLQLLMALHSPTLPKSFVDYATPIANQILLEAQDNLQKEILLSNQIDMPKKPKTIITPSNTVVGSVTPSCDETFQVRKITPDVNNPVFGLIREFTTVAGKNMAYNIINVSLTATTTCSDIFSVEVKSDIPYQDGRDSDDNFTFSTETFGQPLTPMTTTPNDTGYTLFSSLGRAELYKAGSFTITFIVHDKDGNVIKTIQEPITSKGVYQE